MPTQNSIPFASYAGAEREAILIAGDASTNMAVVEDFVHTGFLVMTLEDAERFVEDPAQDAEIQYRAEIIKAKAS